VDKIERGDLQGARDEVARGLADRPGDEALLGLAKLLQRKVQDDGGLKDLASKAKEWTDPGREEAARLSGGNPPALWASPIAFRAPSSFQAQAFRPLALGRELQAWARRIGVGDTAGAETFFTRTLLKNPGDLDARRLRGMARRKLGDGKGALEDFTEALRQAPSDSRTRGMRALTLLDLERPGEALEDARKGVELAPRSAAAYKTRAMVFQALGRVEEMLADLRIAASLDGAYQEAYEAAVREQTARSLPRWKSVVGRGLWLGAILLGLFLLRKLLFRREAPTAVRPWPPAGPSGFDIVRRIGAGGMGEVFEGVDRALGRKVALKKMLPAVASDPRERRRFIREARLVASLAHPNIVEIYSVLDEPEGIYLVFELMEGRPLNLLLAERLRLAPEEALGVLRPVAAALDYAHSKGIIHEDLKPGNIMVSEGAVKVMDFGIARRLQDPQSTLSRLEISGTPDYMAPEHEMGSPCPASDIFALGVCLYESLSGMPPFLGSGLSAKVDGRFSPLSAAAGLPGGVDQVMSRALSAKPEGRFRSGGELLEAFSGALGGKTFSLS
jgi:tetratricopeptide (TPR) repeat protein